MRRIFATLFLASALACAGYARQYACAPALDKPGLPNMHVIAPGLYRGAQPAKEGFEELSKMGIKTVINLRDFHTDKKMIGALPLNYQSIPIKTWDLGDKQVEQFVRIVADKDNYPIFFHCQHGADRTGTMAAVYRIVFEEWPKEEALKEMTTCPYGYHSIWKNLRKYIMNLDVEKFKKIKQEAQNK